MQIFDRPFVIVARRRSDLLAAPPTRRPPGDEGKSMRKWDVSADLDNPQIGTMVPAASGACSERCPGDISGDCPPEKIAWR